MSKKRRLVYNGHYGVAGEEAQCLWCGRLTTEHAFVVNPGGTPVLKCCCEGHYELTEEFIERDSRIRPIFYVVIGALCLASALSMWLEFSPVWSSLPLVGIAAAILVWPRVLPRYEYYLPLGLVRTRKVVRVIACALLAFSLVVTAARFGLIPG
ncbi:hypothetical protein [Thermophilibacter provencensis]|uniref:hypothetical protein n=1 Tax=Thermophilibacter provencensis TaxID=1852386 RepID=UPI002357E101|nr:hypothetical protein [Thermophilibacter provencensis]